MLMDNAAREQRDIPPRPEFHNHLYLYLTLPGSHPAGCGARYVGCPNIGGAQRPLPGTPSVRGLPLAQHRRRRPRAARERRRPAEPALEVSQPIQREQEHRVRHQLEHAHVLCEAHRHARDVLRREPRRRLRLVAPVVTSNEQHFVPSARARVREREAEPLQPLEQRRRLRLVERQPPHHQQRAAAQLVRQRDLCPRVDHAPRQRHRKVAPLPREGDAAAAPLRRADGALARLARPLLRPRLATAATHLVP
mmetsp:Transcript_12177/g.36439  ORF Transcript_12177/g.36439 Transcript_12177/m.36439 type:complete len:251 (-) Transcript_12177:375-1127(-)